MGSGGRRRLKMNRQGETMSTAHALRTVGKCVRSWPSRGLEFIIQHEKVSSQEKQARQSESKWGQGNRNAMT